MILASCIILCAAIFTRVTVLSDEPAADTVGVIEGDSISVQGPMSVEVVRGVVKTVLRSGSDIRVKSGQARIELVEGGHLAICGPAHLSVLKSGNSLTVALDSGTIHAQIDHGPALTVYTAQIQAKPMAIGDAPVDLLVGFDSPGAMCIRATAGAIRVEQQLAAQSVIVPQGGDIFLSNGQLDTLRSAAGRCACEMQMSKAAPAPPPEVSRLATPEEARNMQAESKKSPAVAEKAPATEEPIYQVFMPPLSFDAKAKVQPDNYDPQLIALVRRVRVRPTLIFQGKVEGDPVAAKVTPPAVPATAAAQANKPVAPQPAPKPTAPSAQNSDTIANRVRAFFHRLFS
ncbi:MAG TPA: hypothetical protein VGI16_03220 [Candidatus Acidoferrum sp.]|jgi:hypothetical protein